jgi:large subunit ribosomal protein L9
MKVILREEVDTLGNAGDVVVVKDGYARNYLFPRKLAMRADERNTKQLDHVKRAMLARRSRLADRAKKAAKTIEEVGRVVVTRSCGADGKLFGSVTTRDVAAAFAERGIELDRRDVQLTDALKMLGDFDVGIKLGQGVTATIKVSVEPDAASAELIAQAAAEAKGESAGDTDAD